MKFLLIMLLIMISISCATQSGRTLINNHLQKNNEGIQQCYLKKAIENPSLKGKVEVKFTVKGTGEVINTELVSSTFEDKEIGECIVEEISKIRFPESKQKKMLTINYPIEFSSKIEKANINKW